MAKCLHLAMTAGSRICKIVKISFSETRDPVFMSHNISDPGTDLLPGYPLPAVGSRCGRSLGTLRECSKFTFRIR